ncbi:uncharacterized protein LOC110983528 isoform X2 [Acanthaster planci]|uniref:Uncharacterized protein LOC110983528 isoform X2 n=1 Tax=Acanthaster planci TaxID=133434 RepID=A0A8B7YYW1_ACAPL|nr:uncharacterized protein LOC110983528 isoform X2 [Acanthaster planci]
MSQNGCLSPTTSRTCTMAIQTSSPTVCTEDSKMENARKWLQSGTEACVKVCAIIEKTSLVKDIRKMSCSQQTSSLESFHSLINQFAPKMKAFSHAGIVSRLFSLL